ncbi:chitin binding peritrophin-A domain-containing protein [Nocardia brasiliensis]|uniref:chitin binding peritrophin-A domain-containing protein n=1 Tax=Nocardia brasiliensis TaxID=37326 RepID=UPI003D8F5629
MEKNGSVIRIEKGPRLGCRPIRVAEFVTVVLALIGLYGLTTGVATGMPPHISPACLNVEDEFVGVPFIPDMFYFCHDGVAYPAHCEAGTRWDDEAERCTADR